MPSATRYLWTLAGVAIWSVLSQSPATAAPGPAASGSPAQSTGTGSAWRVAQLGTANERLRGRPTPVPPQQLPAQKPPSEPAPPADLPAATQAPPPADAAVADVDGEDDRPGAQTPREQLLLERGAILLPSGTLQLEPSFDYTHFSGNRVAISGLTLFEAITIGRIQVDKLKRDILTASLTARYGITDRLQLDLRVPYVYRRDEELLAAGSGNEFAYTRDAFGLGDISATVSVQPILGGGAVPAVILRGEGTFPTGEDTFEIDRVEVTDGVFRLERPPTGSGFWSAGGGATMVWRVDPVVFFAGGGYTVNLEREVEGTTINPGNTVEFFGGLNIGLSDKVGINMSFVDQITAESEQNGVVVPGSQSNDARLVLGASVGLNENMSLLTSAGVGLTEDSPDFQFTISLPITFNLF